MSFRLLEAMFVYFLTKVYRIIEPAIKLIWRNADGLIANSQGLKKMALAYDRKRLQYIIPQLQEIQRQADKQIRLTIYYAPLSGK